MECRRCRYFGEVLGAYEPIRVVLDDGTGLRGSALTLGDVLDAPEAVAVHERCYFAWWVQRSDEPSSG